MDEYRGDMKENLRSKSEWEIKMRRDGMGGELGRIALIPE